jgi:DsbC/DsbD-like thiol-disulfide interchange protein
MRKAWFISLLLTAAACSGEENDGALPPPSTVVEWSATAESGRPAHDGARIVDVTLRANVEAGWKLYSLTQGSGGPVAMTVKLDSLSPYRLAGAIRGPAADKAMDPNFDIETETYSGEAVFVVPVKVPAGSNDPIDLKVRSQACSDKLCLPAKTTTVSVPAPAEGA